MFQQWSTVYERAQTSLGNREKEVRSERQREREAICHSNEAEGREGERACV
jgi:hypothetical protein